MPCSPERSPGCLRRACICLHSRPSVGSAGPDVCLWGRTETGTQRGFTLLFSLCGRVTDCHGCSGLCPFHYRIFQPLPRFFFESERASECAYRSGGGGPLLSALLPLTPPSVVFLQDREGCYRDRSHRWESDPSPHAPRVGPSTLSPGQQGAPFPVALSGGSSPPPGILGECHSSQGLTPRPRSGRTGQCAVHALLLPWQSRPSSEHTPQHPVSECSQNPVPAQIQPAGSQGSRRTLA